MAEQLYAFWKYDASVLMVPYEEGVKLHEKLNKAKKKYDLRLQKATKDLMAVADSIREKARENSVCAAYAGNIKEL